LLQLLLFFKIPETGINAPERIGLSFKMAIANNAIYKMAVD
jgi:hypothetical protein